jgi:hypothetical protein
MRGAGMVALGALALFSCKADPAKPWRDLTIPRTATEVRRGEIQIGPRRAQATWCFRVLGSWSRYRSWLLERLEGEDFVVFESAADRVSVRISLEGDLVFLELRAVTVTAEETEVEVMMTGVPW